MRKNKRKTKRAHARFALFHTWKGTHSQIDLFRYLSKLAHQSLLALVGEFGDIAACADGTHEILATVKQRETQSEAARGKGSLTEVIAARGDLLQLGLQRLPCRAVHG